MSRVHVMSGSSSRSSGRVEGCHVATRYCGFSSAKAVNRDLIREVAVGAALEKLRKGWQHSFKGNDVMHGQAVVWWDMGIACTSG